MSDPESAPSTKEAAPLKPVPLKPVFPEGGKKGWMTVLASWCVMFNTFGYINAFGYDRLLPCYHWSSC